MGDSRTYRIFRTALLVAEYLERQLPVLGPTGRPVNF